MYSHQAGTDDTENVALEGRALLRNGVLSIEAGVASASDQDELRTDLYAISQEMKAQVRIWAPFSCALVAQFTQGLTSLAFVGHLGTSQLAATALGMEIYAVFGKLIIMGLCGALDTYTAQAAGSGNYAAMGPIFQRAVLLLAIHLVPMVAFFLALPPLLRVVGYPEELTRGVGAFLLAIIPALLLDAVFRPLNRTLVAQGITAPQMWLGIIVAAQHIGATYLCVHTLRGGYLGAAWATDWSSFLYTTLLAAYVRVVGLQDRVWGTPSKIALQGWGPYTRLAWASCAMKCLESWSMSLCTIAAGWLPNADSAVAAMAVCGSLYSILYMAFAGPGVAACTRVGNALGAGKAGLAKLAACAAAMTAPLLWVLAAVFLLTPPTQRLLIGLFTKDQALADRLRHLLYLLAALELFDGGQIVLTGVVAGAGKQARGFLVNLIAHWGLGLPAAMMLGFYFRLGVEGLLGGMILGPCAQCCCYCVLVWRLQWAEEAGAAKRRVVLARAVE